MLEHTFGRLKVDKYIGCIYTNLMNDTKIIGRTEECERLRECVEEDSAQLVIVYGRRRVGKTFLVNQFFDNQLLIF